MKIGNGREGSRLDFSKTEYIVKIAELRSMSKAAKALYVSQPALTKYVNKLEAELGTKLFDRTVTPIQITYAGERYIAEMNKILDIKQGLDREIEEIAYMRGGRLVLGIGSARGMFWLPYILPPFMCDYPGIEVRIVEGTSDEFEEGMMQGVIDISIYALPVKAEGIDYEVLMDERMVLAVPQGHELLAGRDLSRNGLDNLLYIEPQRLNGQHFIGLTPGQGLHRTCQLIFERHGIKPESVMELTNSDTAFLLACQGLGLAFTPEDAALNLKVPRQPIYCTVDDPPYTRKIVAAYKKHRSLSRVARKFIETTRTIVTTAPELSPR